MELYPSLKPLPKTVVQPKPVGKYPTGMVPRAVYERRQFEAAFKKPEPRR